MEMATTQIIEKIAIAYTNSGEGWARIAEIAKAAGLSPEQMDRGIKDLITEPGFRAEGQPLNSKITEADRKYAVIVGGEPRHMINWQ
jgi:hypothetical protein